MSKNLLWLFAAVVLWTTPSFAQDDEPKNEKAAADPAGQEEAQEESQEDENSPKALLKKCELEMQATMEKLSERAQEIQKEFADDEDADDKIMKAFEGLREEMAESNKVVLAKVMEIAAMVDEDKKTALTAAMMVLQQSEDESLKARAAGLVTKFHLDNEHLGEAISNLRGGLPSKTTFDLFQNIVDGSKSEKIRGMATMAQIGFIEQLQQIAPMTEGDSVFTKSYPQLVEFVKSMKDELDDDAIIKRYEKLIEVYGDVEAKRGTIAKLVERKLKAIKVRAMTAVGKVAPDIEGPDIDGTSFKLSDYRGKVVMLDFWGDW